MAPQNVFFQCLYFSEYDIGMFAFIFWLGNKPSREMMEGTWGAREGGGVEVIQKCLQVRTMCTGAYRRRRVSHLMCMYAVTLSLFMFLSHGVLFNLKKFNLIFIEKGCVCQKSIDFCCTEISFFSTLNCFSEPEIAKTLLILIK